MLAAESLTSEVDFVGSMTNNPQGCSSSTGNFDTGHEGHSGWQAVDIAQQYISGWAADAQPDIANFMLGTNDITFGRSVEEIIAAYDTMLEALRAVNPNIKVIVCHPFSLPLLPLPPTPFFQNEANKSPGRQAHPPLLRQRPRPGPKRRDSRLGRAPQHR